MNSHRAVVPFAFTGSNNGSIAEGSAGQSIEIVQIEATFSSSSGAVKIDLHRVDITGSGGGQTHYTLRDVGSGGVIGAARYGAPFTDLGILASWYVSSSAPLVLKVPDIGFEITGTTGNAALLFDVTYPSGVSGTLLLNAYYDA